MTIIDAHTHVFPDNVMAKIWRYFDQHHWPIHYRGSEAERAEFLAARTAAYTTLCYAHRPGMAAWLNDYALAYAQAHPEAVPTGTFHPDDPDVGEYVAAGIRRGLRGFKVHAEVQRFDPADPRLAPVYGLLSEAGCPVHLHTAGMPLAGPWTGPAHFARLLQLAPRLTVIVAHLGGAEHLEYARLGEDHPVYFDTAMVDVVYPGFPRPGEADLAAIRARPERYLFGTDFPNIPYPWEHQVEVVRAWGLGEEGEALVFAGNFQRIYGLSGPPCG